MWAIYLGIVCLVVPEFLFYVYEWDTNPRIWWIASLVLLIGGAAGRLIEQGIDRSKMQSSKWVGLLAVIAVVGGFLMVNHTSDKAPIGVDNVAAVIGDMPTTEAAFLAHAVPFVGEWEGLRLEAYRDLVGIWTVCYGETKGVKPGDTYTKAECDAMFSLELVDYRNRLHPAFSEETKAKRLHVKRDVAFAGLAYNVGVAGTRKSTAVRRLNEGDVAGACEAITLWNKAGGRVVRGLVRRRSHEYTLCLDGIA